VCGSVANVIADSRLVAVQRWRKLSNQKQNGIRHIMNTSTYVTIVSQKSNKQSSTGIP